MTPPPPELEGDAVEYFDICCVVVETKLEGVVLKAENAGAAVEEETNSEGAVVVGKAVNLEPDRGGEMEEEETTEEEEIEEENFGKEGGGGEGGGLG